MRFWIVALRIAGSLIFAVGTVGETIRLFLPHSFHISDYHPYIVHILELAVMALLCFGAASALNTLRRMDERTRRQNAALRQLLPNSFQRRDLAPHAPTNWQEYKPRPVEPEREKDSGLQQRLAQRGRYTNVNLEDASQEFTRPIAVRRRGK